MTLIIVIILILSYLLIATSNLTKVNKTAIAIFAAAVGWVLYICFGTDFVMSQHPDEYTDFLGGAVPTSEALHRSEHFPQVCGQGSRDCAISACHDDYCRDSEQ